LGITDILRTFIYGFKLDISVTAYILFLPLLLLVLSAFINQKLILGIIRVYSLILLVVIGFIIIADIELYSFWGFRIDTTPLLYIKDKEAITASLTYWQFFKILLILICWWTITI